MERLKSLRRVIEDIKTKLKANFRTEKYNNKTRNLLDRFKNKMEMTEE